jgi:hypothetical protein
VLIPDGVPLQAYTFVSAELYCLLARSRDIQVIAKRPSQRSGEEQKSVERGLTRSFLIESVALVPISAQLMILVIAPFFMAALSAHLNTPALQAGAYSALGIVSYGFPFATVRTIVSRIALNTLKEFAAISHSTAVVAGQTKGVGAPDV